MKILYSEFIDIVAKLKLTLNWKLDFFLLFYCLCIIANTEFFLEVVLVILVNPMNIIHNGQLL